MVCSAAKYSPQGLFNFAGGKMPLVNDVIELPGAASDLRSLNHFSVRLLYDYSGKIFIRYAFMVVSVNWIWMNNGLHRV